MAWQLIRTDAPRGSLVEHGGRTWMVHGPSPTWAGEQECEAMTDEQIAAHAALRALGRAYRTMPES